MSSLKSRVLVSVVGIPLLLCVVLLAPDVVIMAALAVLAGIAAHELMDCIGVKGNNFLHIWTITAAILTVISNYCWSDFLPVIGALYLMTSLLYAIIKAGEVKFMSVAGGVVAAMLIPYSFSAFLRIEVMGFHRAYLLLPFILSFACDTFAYIVGCSIGKHKLAPKVSPKKSVEGSIGGLAGNVLCGCVFVFVMNRWFGGAISYGSMVTLALACGIVAQIGDLSFSLIKREFGIKDYGKLFLAHGGVLDRFDSVLFVTPVIEILLNFVG